MFQTTTITQKWQMTLPKGIRDSINLTKPGEIFLELVNKKTKTIRIREKTDILDLAGSLKPVKKRSVLRAREQMERNYKRA